MLLWRPQQQLQESAIICSFKRALAPQALVLQSPMLDRPALIKAVYKNPQPSTSNRNPKPPNPVSKSRRGRRNLENVHQALPPAAARRIVLALCPAAPPVQHVAAARAACAYCKTVNAKHSECQAQSQRGAGKMGKKSKKQAAPKPLVPSALKSLKRARRVTSEFHRITHAIDKVKKGSTEGAAALAERQRLEHELRAIGGRGLHSSTFQLNLSRLLSRLVSHRP